MTWSKSKIPEPKSNELYMAFDGKGPEYSYIYIIKGIANCFINPLLYTPKTSLVICKSYEQFQLWKLGLFKADIIYLNEQQWNRTYKRRKLQLVDQLG